MRVVLSSSTAEAVSTVVTMIVDKIESHPASVIGLATGKTMEAVYAEWVRVAQDRSLKLDQSFYFMLDEYVGLPDQHPESFRVYIQRRLLNPLELKKSQISFPPAFGSNLEKDASDYERLLKESGGIDLQLLGVGTNGHIGFNEPGSEKTSRTRRVKLTTETREANKVHFPEGNMPAEALSMGIGTILEAKSLVLLATGKSKADVIKYLMNHHDDSKCPITYLKSHADFTLVLDPDAASKINLKI